VNKVLRNFQNGESKMMNKSLRNFHFLWKKLVYEVFWVAYYRFANFETADSSEKSHEIQLKSILYESTYSIVVSILNWFSPIRNLQICNKQLKKPRIPIFFHKKWKFLKLLFTILDPPFCKFFKTLSTSKFANLIANS